MATIEEASVRVWLSVQQVPDADGGLTLVVRAHAVSRTEDGEVVRKLDRDISDQLSTAQRNGAVALLESVEGKIKLLWDIP